MWKCRYLGACGEGSHEGPAAAEQRTSRGDLVSGSVVFLLVFRPLETHWSKPLKPLPRVHTHSTILPDSSGAHSSISFSNLLGEVLRTEASKESIQQSQDRRSGWVTSQLTSEVGRRKIKVLYLTRRRFTSYRVRENYLMVWR